MKKRLIPLIALVIGITFAFSSCAEKKAETTTTQGSSTVSQTENNSSESATANAVDTQTEKGTWQSFKAKGLDEKMYTQSVFSGKKLTMINIWATFCGPCLEEMPELGELAKEYSDKGFQIVGIVIDAAQKSDGSYEDSMVKTAVELVEETNADYIHLLPSTSLMSNALARIASVPTTVFVNEKGEQVGESYVGSRSGSEWKEIIDDLLK